jgi:hypothetical protein
MIYQSGRRGHPNLQDNPAFRLAARLDALRDELVGLLFADPLRGPAAAAEAGLAATDLVGDDRRNRAVAALAEALAAIDGKLGRGIRCRDAIPLLIRHAADRIEGVGPVGQSRLAELWLCGAAYAADLALLNEPIGQAIPVRLAEVRRLAAAANEAARLGRAARRAGLEIHRLADAAMQREAA